MTALIVTLTDLQTDFPQGSTVKLLSGKYGLVEDHRFTRGFPEAYVLLNREYRVGRWVTASEMVLVQRTVSPFEGDPELRATFLNP